LRIALEQFRQEREAVLPAQLRENKEIERACHLKKTDMR
jgi:hypothetical protein